jgi:hypothetical protein
MKGFYTGWGRNFMLGKAISRFQVALLAATLYASVAVAAPLDLATVVKNAVQEGATADQIIQVLQDKGVDVLDAAVIAIHNAPQEMAGELTEAAMDRVPVDQQEEIGYLALSAASGVGSCKVAQVIGITPPAICAELIRKSRPVSKAPSVGTSSGGGQSASPGAV